MFQKAFLFAGTLLLTGAAVLMMPGFGQAQHGGGGHGGGGHFGGGGAHFAGGSGHFSAAHYGGYRGGMYRGDGRSHYGYGRNRSYYGGYGYYPYYGLYDSYYPYYYDTYPYPSSSPTYDSGYSGTYGEVAPDFGYGTASAAPPAGDYPTFYPSTAVTAQPDTTAHVTAKAPADAQLWFDGTATTSTGPVREFNSPPLTPGSLYSYEVQARWNENGHDVTQTQRVEVTAGAHVSVSFPVPPKTAGQASAVKKG